MRTSLVAVAALLAATSSGCVSFKPDGGFGEITQATRTRVGKDVKWARTEGARDSIAARVIELLRKPLSADDAVQIALLNNRGLQASFFELGISESNLVQAGRMPNPRVSLTRAQRDGDVKIEQSLTVNLFALLVMPPFHLRTRFLESPPFFQKAAVFPKPHATHDRAPRCRADPQIWGHRPASAIR